MHKLPWPTWKRLTLFASLATFILAILAVVLLWLLETLYVLLPPILGGAAILAMVAALVSPRDCEITVIHRRG